MTKLNRLKSPSAIVLFCALTAIPSQAQTLTTLFSFDGQGASPGGALAQGLDGNFYGTTEYGGIDFGGTIFRLTPANQLRHFSFCTVPGCADGVAALGELTLGRDANFYGSAEGGGVHGGGTVFRLTASGTLSALYSFCAQGACVDGNVPMGGVVQGSNGDFYGTTVLGGANNHGEIFSVSEAGVETTLHSFCPQINCRDGASPTGGLVLATDGNLYGTASYGGDNGLGAVFKITATGKLSRLYSFCPQEPNCSDGKGPVAGLIQASDGNFYGTTEEGGTFGSGTIFKITPEGVLTTLYSFCAQISCADGANPDTSLIQATDGNFYGTTPIGGTGFGDCLYQCGTVFEITPAGNLTTLYNFCSQGNCSDGNSPIAALIQATNGNLYGTTSIGGDPQCLPAFHGCGTVFTLATGLRPFVESNPTFGKVGNEIKVLGNNLTGTTSVTFNGAPARYTVVLDTYIRATVPDGATTGAIQVTTPSGTLNSNVAFQVLP